MCNGLTQETLEGEISFVSRETVWGIELLKVVKNRCSLQKTLAGEKRLRGKPVMNWILEGFNFFGYNLQWGVFRFGLEEGIKVIKE